MTVVHAAATHHDPAVGEVDARRVGEPRLVIEGAPHRCLWTHADEVNGALLEFLGERAPARSGSPAMTV